MSEPQNPKIVQKRFLMRQQSFEITPEHELHVVVKGPCKEEKWTTPLRMFDPSPTRVRKLDLKPLILVAPLALIAVPALVAGFLALLTGKPSYGIFLIAAFFGIPCAGFIFLILRNRTNVLSLPVPQGLVFLSGSIIPARLHLTVL